MVTILIQIVGTMTKIVISCAKPHHRGETKSDPKKVQFLVKPSEDKAAETASSSCAASSFHEMQSLLSLFASRDAKLEKRQSKMAE